MATGETFRSLATQYRVSPSWICRIVKKCLESIVKRLFASKIPPPTLESMKKNASEFSYQWNYPNCVGAIDGKHIRIRCPSRAGSLYYNYKNFHSIVLLAIVDANYKFVAIDVGSYGREGDAGTRIKIKSFLFLKIVFSNQSTFQEYFLKAIWEKELLITNSIFRPLKHCLDRTSYYRV